MAKNKSKKKSKKDKFFSWLDQYATKHWFFTSFCIVGASWWFSLMITFFGEQLNLISIDDNGSKSFTILGVVLTGIVFLFIILNTALSKYRKELPDNVQKELNETRAGFNLLDKLMSSVSKVCDSKFSKQIKKIESIIDNGEEPPVIYSSPCNQFEMITKELVDCLVFILNTDDHRIKTDSLYASIAYNFPVEKDNVWQWADVENQKGLDLDTLLSEDSTFSYLLNHPKTFEFYNSKQDAYDERKYVPDEHDKYDEQGKLLGSILCYEIIIKRNDKTYVRAILSVTSYDIQFVDAKTNDEETKKAIINTRENIRKIILSEFEKRIKIELCNYYIQFLRNKWKEKNQIDTE